MKKLSKFEKGFSSLENKKLSDLKSISGGEETRNVCTEETSPEGGGSDLRKTQDGRVVWTIETGEGY